MTLQSREELKTSDIVMEKIFSIFGVYLPMACVVDIKAAFAGEPL